MSLPTQTPSGSASASASQPSQPQPAMTFATFFQDAFARSRGTSQAPYGYQCRLAGGPNAAPDGAFTHGTECRSQLINIPTGLGKTAGVVLAWLWNRVGLRTINSQQSALQLYAFATSSRHLSARMIARSATEIGSPKVTLNAPV